MLLNSFFCYLPACPIAIQMAGSQGKGLVSHFSLILVSSPESGVGTLVHKFE